VSDTTTVTCVRSSAAIADAYRIGWISAVAAATKFSDLAAIDRVRDRGLAQDKDQVPDSDLQAAGPAQDKGLRRENLVQIGRQAENALRSGPQADEAATLWEILDRAGSLIGRPRAVARVSEAVASVVAVAAAASVAAVVVAASVVAVAAVVVVVAEVVVAVEAEGPTSRSSTISSCSVIFPMASAIIASATTAATVPMSA
jgi:hypothetical protein